MSDPQTPAAPFAKPVVDLSALDTIKACNDGAEIELLHPVTKAPLGQFISIVGKDSDAFNAYVEESSDADTRKAFVNQRKGRVPDPKYLAARKAETIQLLVACTTGFRNVMFGGAPLAFNEANATKLYTSLPWVKQQIDDAVIDYENFIKS